MRGNIIEICYQTARSGEHESVIEFGNQTSIVKDLNSRIRSVMLRRAGDLAKGGAYSDYSGVVRQLQSEGFTEAPDAFMDQLLRVQIDLACKKACNAQGR